MPESYGTHFPCQWGRSGGEWASAADDGTDTLTDNPVMPSRVDHPLIRRRDGKPIGTLSIVRANHWSFGDDRHRQGSPKRTDQLLITLADATGEEICYLEVPMDQLPADD